MCIFSHFAAVAEQNLQKLMSVKLEDVSQPRHVTEDLHVDPEADPVHFLSLIVESLAALRRMPQAIEVCHFRLSSVKFCFMDFTFLSDVE